MKRLIFTLMFTVLLAALLCAAGSAIAASITVDVPTSYTLNDRTPNNQNNAPVKDQTSNDVSGFKILVTGAHHLGVGYEDYEVKGKGSSGGGGPFTFATRLHFYDVVWDLPTRFLNFGLGYGAGTVNTNINAPMGGAPHASSAGASQWFASLGIPLGEHFDIHAAYHVVTAKDQKLSNTGGGGPDALNLSGHTLMAGMRLAW